MKDVHEVHKAAIIAVHIGAVNHRNLSRADLKRFAEEKGMASNVVFPNDGDSYYC